MTSRVFHSTLTPSGEYGWILVEDVDTILADVPFECIDWIVDLSTARGYSPRAIDRAVSIIKKWPQDRRIWVVATKNMIRMAARCVGMLVKVRIECVDSLADARSLAARTGS